MDRKNFARAIIETTVDRGIRDMTEDPKRTLRRLADMGKEFSTGKFQKKSFGIITNLLRNDDSPYYKLLENFLATVDHECIKHFGLNMGYDSWTYGARTIRRESGERGYIIPWMILLHHNDQPQGLNGAKIKEIVDTLTPLGTNTYGIIREKGVPLDPVLLETISAHPQAAFFFFIEDGQISAAEASRIKECKNAVISVNISSPDAADTCRALRDTRALFTIHYRYSSDEVARFYDPEYIDNWLTYGSAFIFLFQKDGFSGTAGNFASKTRMDQLYPILIWDVYMDMKKVNRMISETDLFLEIGKNGRLIFPEDTGLSVTDTDILSLLEKIDPQSL